MFDLKQVSIWMTRVVTSSQGKSRSKADAQASNFRIGLPFGQHVPKDRRHPTHHCHPGNAASLLAFDLFEPRSHRRIGAKNVLAGLAEHPTRHPATRFGDVTKPLLVTTVAAAGSQPEVVGQRAWTFESFDSRNATRECNGREQTEAAGLHDQLSIFVIDRQFCDRRVERRHTFLKSLKVFHRDL